MTSPSPRPSWNEGDRVVLHYDEPELEFSQDTAATVAAVRGERRELDIVLDDRRGFVVDDDAIRAHGSDQ